MNGMTPLESAITGAGRSSRTCHSGEGTDLAQIERSRRVQSIKQFVARHPGLCLGAALSFGVILGWWMKRS